MAATAEIEGETGAEDQAEDSVEDHQEADQAEDSVEDHQEADQADHEEISVEETGDHHQVRHAVIHRQDDQALLIKNHPTKADGATTGEDKLQ